MEAYYLYQIEFPNEKKYIGISNNPTRRWAVHKTNARKGSHKQIVSTAIRKHGEDNITFRILVKGVESYIRDLERKTIELYRTREHEFGYNQAIGGENSPVAGIGHTAESKAKMSISQKLRVHTPAEIAKMAASLKGRIFSLEHREKLKGSKTEEHCQNLSASIQRSVATKIAERGYWTISGMLGKTHSEETKTKIREKRALQVITEDAKRKMSDSQKARWKKIKEQKAKVIEPIIPEL